jgi:peptide-methionine (S)-S-oxide reductase
MKLTNVFRKKNKQPTNETIPKKKKMDKKDICPELSLEPEVAPTNEVTVVSCGWFWVPQLRLLSMKGVVRCVVGYSGDQKIKPNYRNIMDHIEALLIEFDPEVVTYEDLLISWSRMHSPTSSAKCQYCSAVWYLNEDQQAVAEGILEGIKALTKGKVTSKVEPVTRFYRAEEYHQNYLAKKGGGFEWNGLEGNGIGCSSRQFADAEKDYFLRMTALWVHFAVNWLAWYAR